MIYATVEVWIASLVGVAMMFPVVETTSFVGEKSVKSNSNFSHKIIEQLMVRD
jgi:hypothetical protein